MRFLAPPHQCFLKLTFLKIELWVYLRHIEAKAHGLIKKPALAPYLKEDNPKVLGEAKRGRKGHMTPMEEEVLIGTAMIADRISAWR
jgi:hypothetical protein